jgi:hypothetical protein
MPDNQTTPAQILQQAKTLQPRFLKETVLRLLETFTADQLDDLLDDAEQIYDEKRLLGEDEEKQPKVPSLVIKDIPHANGLPGQCSYGVYERWWNSEALKTESRYLGSIPFLIGEKYEIKFTKSRVNRVLIPLQLYRDEDGRYTLQTQELKPVARINNYRFPESIKIFNKRDLILWQYPVLEFPVEAKAVLEKLRALMEDVSQSPSSAKSKKVKLQVEVLEGPVVVRLLRSLLTSNSGEGGSGLMLSSTPMMLTLRDSEGKKVLEYHRLRRELTVVDLGGDLVMGLLGEEEQGSANEIQRQRPVLKSRMKV